jgi:hypothetical protein
VNPLNSLDGVQLSRTDLELTVTFNFGFGVSSGGTTRAHAVLDPPSLSGPLIVTEMGSSTSDRFKVASFRTLTATAFLIVVKWGALVRLARAISLAMVQLMQLTWLLCWRHGAQMVRANTLRTSTAAVLSTEEIWR